MGTYAPTVSVEGAWGISVTTVVGACVVLLSNEFFATYLAWVSGTMSWGGGIGKSGAYPDRSRGELL